MKKLKIILLLCVFVFTAVLTGCSSPVYDYEALKKDVRTTLQDLLDKGGTSVSYAVMQNGKLLVADAAGYLDGTEKTPATVETLYNIGSISKVYCAAAIMTLVDEGKVKLDDTVVSYLPDFKMPDERYKYITIRMLLNHSSGIQGTAYPLGGSYSEYDTDIYEKAYEVFEKSYLKADPGKFSVYCNDGFMLAEMLIARISGKTYSEYIRDKIFTPLKADSSGFSDRDYAPGSYAVKGTLPHEYLNIMASGGISSNIIDVCKFGQMFLGKNQSILSQKSIKEISSPQGKTFISEDNYSPEYGLGWDSVDNKFDSYDFGKGVLAKSGGTSQFSSQLYVIPQYNMVCAISATSDFSDDAAAVLSDIAADILSMQGHDVAKKEKAATASERKPLPEGFKKDYEGIYSAYNGVLRVTVNDDDSISTALFNGTDYTKQNEKLYYDGSAFTDEKGNKLYTFVEADGKRYLMSVNEKNGYVYPMGQKLEALPMRSAAWSGRTGKLYMHAFVSPDVTLVLPGLTLYEIPSLPGVLISGLGDSLSAMGIEDDDATKMILQIPGSFGRDLYTLRAKTVNGEEWLYTESYDLRPASALAVLEQGLVEINREGENGLYKIPAGELTFSVPEAARVIAYNSSGTSVYDSISDGAAAFDKVPDEGYIRFMGKPGAQFSVTID
jgi:CubicO group peptidase (beta-lactamase class C family)